MENKKNTKKIVIIVVAVVIVAVLAITGIVCLNTGKKSGGKGGDAQVTTVSSDNKKNKGKDPWNDVEVVEETTKSKKDKEVLYKRNKKGEIVTNKKGEKVTRKADYPGEDDGWSPIVSPDDLKKDK